MKYEWRKQEKEIYLPKGKPELIFIKKFRYLTLEGSGNPNENLFSELTGTLFSLSYALKMLPKKGITPDGYFDYAVYPLEGIWDLGGSSDSGKTKLDKDKLIYKIMIRQPDFITKETIKTAIENNNILLIETIQNTYLKCELKEEETRKIRRKY